MRLEVKHGMQTQKKRLLFVSESVTLAQVVRLLELASKLDETRYEVHFAHSWPDDRLFGDAFQEGQRWRITGAGGSDALQRAEEGSLPPKRLLRRQIEEDCELFARVRPEVIIGDFRLSLTISAPLSRIPLLSLINAYWSPRRTVQTLPLPEHRAVRWFGVKTAEKYFVRFAPKAMSIAAKPINELRREHGLSAIGDLHEVLTFGDRTLYPDVPALTPLSEQAPHERFIGPILWSPRIALPARLEELGKRALVYVTMGSSGELGMLPIVLRALQKLPVDVAVSTAGRVQPEALGPAVFAADMLPGDVLSKRAALVITNGGSSTGYQALYEGTPVLGLPSNLDQYLAMSAIDRFGAGILARSGTATEELVGEAAARLLEDSRFSERARDAQTALRAIDPHVELERALGEVALGGS